MDHNNKCALVYIFKNWIFIPDNELFSNDVDVNTEFDSMIQVIPFFIFIAQDWFDTTTLWNACTSTYYLLTAN